MCGRVGSTFLYGRIARQYTLLQIDLPVSLVDFGYVWFPLELDGGGWHFQSMLQNHLRRDVKIAYAQNAQRNNTEPMRAERKMHSSYYVLCG